MAEGLFRKASIDKVSSPEQLDLLMRVTSPVGWLALATVAVMLVAVGVWSVMGSIPDLVDSPGTLFRGERLYDIKATMNGSILTMTVRAGSTVSAGQVIAKLKHEEASVEVRNAIEERMRAARGEIKASKERIAANQVSIQGKRAETGRLRSQLDTMQRQWQLQKQLVDQGIKAPKDLLNIERDMDGIRGQIDRLGSDIEGLEADSKNIAAKGQSGEAELVGSQTGLNTTTEVTSNESGRVVEVIKSAGDKVTEGEPLIRVERQTIGANQYCGGNVHALVYIPTSTAGKIKGGQFVRVSPSDVKREEYGFIFGKVEWVASYAASTADMSEKLKNDQLVKQFMSSGPVVEARICLETDPSNKVNPFKWSSSQGPPKGTEAGTTCSVSVVVDEKKPYTYVIPAVRKAVGL